jgi:hypothetical protein
MVVHAERREHMASKIEKAVLFIKPPVPVRKVLGFAPSVVSALFRRRHVGAEALENHLSREKLNVYLFS